MTRPTKTTPDQVRDLIATAGKAEPPARVGSGRGRIPLYKPMIDHVVANEGVAVVFGPFDLTMEGKATAERIRTGCYSYATDHPEEIPEGRTIHFSLRNEGDELRLYAYLTEKDGADAYSG